MTTLECNSVVFTKHPEGKRGACIPKDDYHQLCSSILGVLEQEDRITLPELIDMVQHDFNAGINANIAWRILVVNWIWKRKASLSPFRISMIATSFT